MEVGTLFHDCRRVRALPDPQGGSEIFSEISQCESELKVMYAVR